jgi:hypothetical protein
LWLKRSRFHAYPTERRSTVALERTWHFETYFGLVEVWPDRPNSARLIAINGTMAAVKYKSALIEP